MGDPHCPTQCVMPQAAPLVTAVTPSNFPKGAPHQPLEPVTASPSYGAGFSKRIPRRETCGTGGDGP